VGFFSLKIAQFSGDCFLSPLHWQLLQSHLNKVSSVLHVSSVMLCSSSQECPKHVFAQDEIGDLVVDVLLALQAQPEQSQPNFFFNEAQVSSFSDTQ